MRSPLLEFLGPIFVAVVVGFVSLVLPTPAGGSVFKRWLTAIVAITLGLALYLLEFLTDWRLQDALRNTMGELYCHYVGHASKCNIFDADTSGSDAVKARPSNPEPNRPSSFEEQKVRDADAKAASERQAKVEAERRAKEEMERRAIIEADRRRIARESERQLAEQRQAESEAQRIEGERLDLEKQAAAEEKNLQPRLTAALATAQRARASQAAQIRALFACPKVVQGKGFLFIAAVPLIATNEANRKELLDKKPAMLGPSVALLQEPEDVLSAISAGKLMSYSGLYDVSIGFDQSSRTIIWRDRTGPALLKVENTKLIGFNYRVGLRLAGAEIFWTASSYPAELNHNSCWSLLPLVANDTAAIATEGP
ncbi:hypothetical protein [Bradyrhizobium guangdongense]|uniref:hypothetical protein n=1 Tax=Bradyrhizobium guangdongense TaxID=1325090 RepID=UPI00112D1ABB|nr:hypothetical protein [Bradyrhizobium guangdongense]